MGKHDDVAINPETGNPVMRTTPEHKLKRVYAKNDMVVIVGVVDGADVENVIERREAISRAQSLSEMAEVTKYPSDRLELQDLVEQFITAIRQAKEYTGTGYKSTSVAMSGLKL